MRHTRVDVPAGTCYGATDVPLADSFAEEAGELAGRMVGPFDAVYSSPLTRCARLAERLAADVPVVHEPALREADFGAWELRAWDVIDADALAAWMADFAEVRPPGGETFTEVYARVVDFVESLRGREHQRVLIVAHAGVIRCLWAYWLAVPLERVFRIPVEHGGVLRLKLTGDPSLDRIVSLS